MKHAIIFFCIGFAIVFLFSTASCSKGSGNTNATATKDSVLINIGNNIIVPSYKSFALVANSLDSAIKDFNTSPNNTKLSNLQAIFKTAYTIWQPVSEYNYFGPASGLQPALTSLNVFPVSSSQIETNISTGNFNVNTFDNTVAKGFPALDYLLFNSDNTALLTAYTTDATASNRQKYLAAVATDIKDGAENALNGWIQNGNNYVNTFNNGTGNSISSSLGLLINSLDQDFEIMKNDKLGIPLGKIPAGSSLPLASNQVEAYYSGVSTQLMLTQLQTTQEVFLGTAQQGNGLGLITYLQKAEQQNNLRYHGGLLSDTIKIHFDAAIAAVQAIPSPLSSNLSNANVSAAFAECQHLITLLKTILPSDLGVLINYGDNDGD